MKRRLTILALTTLAVVALISVVLTVTAPVHAGRGAMQISGIGFWAEEGECTDVVTGPDGQSPDFAFKLTGDLEGCRYGFVETSECRPSGTYKETGAEIYVGEGGFFSMTYRFTAKYELDENGDCDFNKEIFGRCQHPIVAGSGSGPYEGVTGRLDFRDDLDAGNFPYRGHLRW